MTLRAWLSSSMVRHYPASPPPGRAVPVRLDLAMNQSGSLQAVLRRAAPRGEWPAPVTVTARADGFDVRVRRVGYVPMRHPNPGIPDAEADGVGFLPGWTPDPLLEDAGAFPLPAAETHAWWLTVTPSRAAVPGRHALRVAVAPEKGRALELKAEIVLHDAHAAPRKNFTVMEWFHVDSVFDLHRTDGYDERCWRILPAYFDNLARHHHSTVYAPVFTPPLDGERRPSQLLRVHRTGRDAYRFDWRDVKRYGDLARKRGLMLEWTHLFTQSGAERPAAVYENQGREEKALWPPATPAAAPAYRRFLAQFLPAFHAFLEREGWLGHSVFHVSDEPRAEHLENYRRARGLLRELAPWMKTHDALSSIEFAREKLVDTPIPVIETALDFVRGGFPCWTYYCCGSKGRFVNRFLDTPLPKVRIQGFLFYRWPFGGFLHWGYNYWYRHMTREPVDPYAVNDACLLPAGDPFIVYPGANGPVDSMRGEVFAEGLADYALLQSAGVDPGGRELSELNSFEDFPRDEAWIARTRRAALKRLARRRR